MLFDKYLKLIAGTDMTMERNLVRTWIYVTNIDVNYQGVVEARNDVFDQQGLTAETHYIASTGHRRSNIRTSCICSYRLSDRSRYQGRRQAISQALNHLNPTHEYGVAFEQTSLSLLQKKQYFISGTASIDKNMERLYTKVIL